MVAVPRAHARPSRAADALTLHLDRSKSARFASCTKTLVGRLSTDELSMKRARAHVGWIGIGKLSSSINDGGTTALDGGVRTRSTSMLR